MRHTIDVSGDGANNAGPPVAPVRDALVAGGITINGLPLPTPQSGGPFAYLTDAAAPVDLDRYYIDCVIGGAGAFVMPVDGPSTYFAAIRRKLVLEIAGLPARVFAASFRISSAAECANTWQ
jgi:hypothetical protein